jgi:cytochrome P450
LLAKHQSIQEKLRAEILLKGYKCKYLEMVWNESLRLYPPVVGFVSRITSEDTVINGLFIEKNTSVQAPVWRIQHNPNIWSNPYDFNPERFSPENKSQINPLAFLAFGLGPRSCIGADFARLEAMITISIILTNFRIEFCEQTNDPLVLRCPTGVVIKPSVPIYLRFSSISE